MKTTEWIPGHTKPVHVDVYQQRAGHGNAIGYQFWDGTRWGIWASTIDDAMNNCSIPACHYFQDDPWRGLVK